MPHGWSFFQTNPTHTFHDILEEQRDCPEQFSRRFLRGRMPFGLTPANTPAVYNQRGPTAWLGHLAWVTNCSWSLLEGRIWNPSEYRPPGRDASHRLPSSWLRPKKSPHREAPGEAFHAHLEAFHSGPLKQPAAFRESLAH